jgi:streptogramin lyase
MPAATREGGVLVGRARSQVLRLIALGIAIVAALAVALGATLSAAHAAPIGALKQFRVPTADSEPRSITNGSDGNRWFVESNLDSVLESPAIGRITPAGDITEFPVNCSFCSLSDIVQGPNDILYYTSNDPILGRITTSGAFLDPIPMPNSNALGGELAVHGNEIWITDFNHRSIWRYDTGTGGFTEFPIGDANTFGPHDVAVAENGVVWFGASVLSSSGEEGLIGRLDPAAPTTTPTVTTFNVDAVPRAVNIATDNKVWFAARFTPQAVGFFDPATSTATVFPADGGPQDIAPAADGSMWFTRTTAGNIARISPDGVITEGKVVKNSEPFGITVAPNGDPWYTMLEANKIATLQLR